MKPVALSGLMLFSVAASAGNGMILFTGSIYESGCHSFVIEQELRISCYQQGEWRQQAESLAELGLEKTRSTPVTDMQLTWLDSQQKMGIVTISLH
ncbi:hypothetical protein [Mixta calida]|uniref:hypothetical protein n=1 Tax=Mixta calida TaxID=665913 RepID=UPI00403AFB5E